MLCFDKNVILQHIEKKATDNDSWGVNETCRIHLQRYLIGLNNSETWALESKWIFTVSVSLSYGLP